MDFTKPIYGEVEGFIDTIAAKEYFKSHGIEYQKEDLPEKLIQFEDNGRSFTINGKRFDMREFLGKDDK